MMENKQTQLGWLVNVLMLMLQASSVLVEDIDQQLAVQGNRFHQEKKKHFNSYKRCIEQARGYMERFGLDTSCWEAVGEDSRAYTNVIADANELIRVVMLYVDRAHSEDGYYKIMRYLRSLPANGLFDEKYIARFNMHHQWIPGKGDRVHTTNHGDGIIEAKVNEDNYIINLDSGGQTVLKEGHFSLI